MENVENIFKNSYCSKYITMAVKGLKKLAIRDINSSLDFFPIVEAFLCAVDKDLEDGNASRALETLFLLQICFPERLLKR